MALNVLAGKSGYVNTGGASYSFDKWSAPMKTGLPKTTNFNSGGARTLVVGILEGDIDLEGPYDEGNMPFTVGSSYTFHLGYTTGVELVITAVVESITPTVSVEDAQKVSIKAKSNGTFTAVIV